jgi:AraC-like DNA-binding protein
MEIFIMQRKLGGTTYFSPDFPLYIMELTQGDIEAHSHDFYEMVYVRSGHGDHWIGDEVFPIHAGDLYVINPGERHRYAPAKSEPLRIINLLWLPSLVGTILKEEDRKSTFTLRYLEPLSRKRSRFEHRLNLSGSAAFRVEALLDEMLREQNAMEKSALPGSALLLRNLFCALLVLLSRAIIEKEERAKNSAITRHSPQRGMVETAISYLEKNMAQQIRIADVAAHVALSESRMSHLFKEHTGLGIIAWLHQHRIARCCSLLLQSDVEIGQAARQVGYNDIRFFYRIFRRHTGCNPSQYRKHFGG